MSLKILLVPLLVIGILVISIGYIKPDITLLLEKKKIAEAVDSKLDRLEVVITNVQSMKAKIASSRSESGSDVTDANFLRGSYFPIQSDIEKQIDRMNFLAVQSGIALGDIQVSDQKKDETVVAVQNEESMATSADLLLVKSQSGDDLVEVPVSVRTTYTPETFALTVVTTGSYDATKNFYNGIMKSKRFLSIESVSLGEQEPTSGASEEKKLDPNALQSSVTIIFSLLKPVSIPTAFGNAAFDTDVLNFGLIGSIRQNTETAIPVLPQADTLGKPNLFF